MENSLQKVSIFSKGLWQEAKSYFPISNPYSGEIIAKVADTKDEEADELIQVAQDAFDDYKNLPAFERSEILYKLSRIFEEKKELFSEIISIETAKPLRYAKGEIDRCIQTYRFSAEEAKQIRGETIPMDAAKGGNGRLGFTIREPIGLVGAITPFNFPFNLVAHKVGPALAAGNTIILKPSEQGSLSALALIEALKKAGLPPGVVQLAPGRGDVIGKKLVESDLIQKISFTGSLRVGKEIQKKLVLKNLPWNWVRTLPLFWMKI